jgi:hypothetical protein
MLVRGFTVKDFGNKPTNAGQWAQQRRWKTGIGGVFRATGSTSSFKKREMAERSFSCYPGEAMSVAKGGHQGSRSPLTP